MQNRKIVKTFRCTEEEAGKLQEFSKKEHLTEAEYIRRKILKNEISMLPAETAAELKKLKYYNLKIGTNINQIVRSCNSKKFITREDYRGLVDLLAKLDETYEKIYEAICRKAGQEK